MWSVMRGNVAAMRELLDRGAAADVRTPDGRTLVELAGKDRRPQVVALLRQYGKQSQSQD